jgi:hypothetical protein
MGVLRRFAAVSAAVFLSLFSLISTPVAQAETVSGLNVDVYTYDPVTTPDRQPYTLCEGAWSHVDLIDQMFDDNNGGVVGGCRQEFVLIHYTGFVTFPDSGNYAFQGWADDGFWLSLDGLPVISNDWVLKGRWGNVYPDVPIVGGHSYALDAWYYEYTGGANVTLTYSPDNGATWATVPSSFYSTSAPDPVVVPVEPPVIVPPVVEPPVVVPPIEPPVVVPPVVEPPVIPVTPPITPVTPPEPVLPPKPVVIPPVVVVPPTAVVAPVTKPSIVDLAPAQIDPQTLTSTQVVELQTAAQQTLATTVEDSPAYNQALEQLYVAAQADDIVVDPAVANVPVLGATVVGITNAINALGNLGSDMSPAHRAKAKKEIVAAVVATGAAVNAVTSAAALAAPTIRRRN